MRKSLALQAELGPVFDVTFDCEDGAPVGREAEHVRMAVDLLMSSENQLRPRRRARASDRPHGVRRRRRNVDPASQARRLPYIMVPKVRDLADAKQAIKAIDAAARSPWPATAPGGALSDRNARRAARCVRDRGTAARTVAVVRADGFRVGAPRRNPGQRDERVRASSSTRWCAAPSWRSPPPATPRPRCHRTAWSPSSSRSQAIQAAASRAAHEFGYTRMWSIHPAQVQPIVEVFAPTVAELDEAIEIIARGRGCALGSDPPPRTRLHDRASYRYYWQVIERARRTRQPLPAEIEQAWFGATWPQITEPTGDST